jgi:hypothetical protein
MMTQQLGFSVLSAPLAQLDRRALSQAWYSALHLASASARPQAPDKHLAVATPKNGSGKPGEAPSRSRKTSVATTPTRASLPPRSGLLEGDRRTTRSSLARKIERAFLHPSRPTRRATFTLGASARVHVALQDSAQGLRIVAVCAPAYRATVARALEEARYALATRGISVGVSVSGARRVR